MIIISNNLKTQIQVGLDSTDNDFFINISLIHWKKR